MADPGEAVVLTWAWPRPATLATWGVLIDNPFLYSSFQVNKINILRKESTHYQK